MKRTFLYTLFAALTIVVFTSCNSDELDGTSIFVDPTIEETNFEHWITKNYIEPYNIDFKYRMEDIESDMNYNLAPATVVKSKQMAVLLKHLCLGSYDEVTGSTDFIRSHFPKMVHLIGSAAYRNNGTMVLGTAEGGLKISLYYINEIRIDNTAHLKTYYFRTLFHEFAHIFHQKKAYSKDFDEITAGGYVTDSWNSAWGESNVSEANARKAGFISAYASKDAHEDFVELLAHYVTNTAAEWNQIMTNAETKGSTILKAKFEIVYSYMVDSWDIDLNKLREVYLRRQSEISGLEFDDLK